MSPDLLTSTSSEHRWSLLLRRLSRPCKQWTFYVVMILGILILGYLSVWIEIAKVPIPYTPPQLSSLGLSYATAILAVGAPSAMQLILTSNRMAVLAGFVLIFLSCFFAYNAFNEPKFLAAINTIGLFGLGVSTFSWWLANGEDDLFQDQPTNNSAA